MKGRCVEQKRTVTTKRWLMEADASDRWESNKYQLAAGASPFLQASPLFLGGGSWPGGGWLNSHDMYNRYYVPAT